MPMLHDCGQRVVVEPGKDVLARCDHSYGSTPGVPIMPTKAVGGMARVCYAEQVLMFREEKGHLVWASHSTTGPQGGRMTCTATAN